MPRRGRGTQRARSMEMKQHEAQRRRHRVWNGTTVAPHGPTAGKRPLIYMPRRTRIYGNFSVNGDESPGGKPCQFAGEFRKVKALMRYRVGSSAPRLRFQLEGGVVKRTGRGEGVQCDSRET